ncbi:MAG: HAD family phosphatase [Clostridia bacterium]|nr:HAD family phosphatase [Clostridia bacterium]
MKITGAIFDFDGTLFDSMHIWKGVRFTFLEHLGITLTDADKKAFEGLTLVESLEYSKNRFGIAQSGDELFTLFFDYIRSRYIAEACPKNDIIQFLEKLKAKGVKIGIATATAEYALKAVLEKYGMLGYFSTIRSTYTVGAAKTQPTVYDTVLEELGTDKETTWVFEDALYAAKTAKANGYNLIGIYDVSEADTAVLEEISDIYIHNYSELEL